MGPVSRPAGPGASGPRFGGPPPSGPGAFRERRPGPPLAPGRARFAGPEVPPLDLEREELVAGRRPVEEAFVARREARRLYVVPQRRQALEKLVLHATSLRIPVIEVEGGSLTALAGFDGHQGIALVVEPRSWASPDEILADARSAGEPPLLVVLDSLEDPQNVGTLLRTAEAAGAHGAIFPTRRQAPLTPAAVKASAGAVEHLRLAPVDDLATTLADLHARGIRIVGADGDAQLVARAADLRGPLAIVVGGEGRGLSAAVRRRCDQLVRIPMRGQVGSLNASVAGSILLYEAAAQRDPTGTARPRRSPAGARRAEPDAAVSHATPDDLPDALPDDLPDVTPDPERPAEGPPDGPEVARDDAPGPSADPVPPDAAEEDLLPGGPSVGADDAPDAPPADAADDPDRV